MCERGKSDKENCMVTGEWLDNNSLYAGLVCSGITSAGTGTQANTSPSPKASTHTPTLAPAPEKPKYGGMAILALSSDVTGYDELFTGKSIMKREEGDMEYQDIIYALITKEGDEQWD